MLATPVQEIAVQCLRLQSFQGCLAGRDRAVEGRVEGQYLGDEEDPVAQSGDCLADDFLGGTIAVSTPSLRAIPTIAENGSNPDNDCRSGWNVPSTV